MSGATGRVAVSTAGVSGQTAVAAVSAGVTLFSLVVLGDLDTLLDVVEFNANDPFVGYAVHGGGSTVVGGDTVSVTVAAGGGLVGLVLDLVLQDDVLDFVEEMRVYVVALGGLVTDGHGGVVTAAAEAADGDGWGGVAVAHRRLSDGTTQEGEGNLLKKVNLSFRYSNYLLHWGNDSLMCDA